MRQRDSPLPSARHHGPIHRQEDLPSSRNKLRSEEGLDDYPFDLAVIT